MSERPRYYDKSADKYFTYNPRDDTLDYEDGSRRRRPDTLPMSVFDRTPRNLRAEEEEEEDDDDSPPPSASRLSASARVPSTSRSTGSGGYREANTPRDALPGPRPYRASSTRETEYQLSSAGAGASSSAADELRARMGSLSMHSAEAGHEQAEQLMGSRSSASASAARPSMQTYQYQVPGQQTALGSRTLISGSAADARSSLRPPAPTPRQDFHNNGLTGFVVFNPENQVRTTVVTGPTPRITDQQLYSQNITAQSMLIGQGRVGETEVLYSSFKVRPASFFCVGRVFITLWAEAAGGTAITNVVRNDLLPGRYQNEYIFSKVRRFVVIREGADCCSVLPIATYGRRGVSKERVKKSDHAIIYTGDQPPPPLEAELPRRNEAPMRHRAIKVVPDNPTDKLDSISRLDFGKVHTVQHNVKARPFGMVHPQSTNDLLTGFNNVWLGASTFNVSIEGGLRRPSEQSGRSSTAAVVAESSRSAESSRPSAASRQEDYERRVESAANAYQRLLDQDMTHAQAVQHIANGLQRQGKSAAAAAMEVGTLLAVHRLVENEELEFNEAVAKLIGELVKQGKSLETARAQVFAALDGQ